MNLYDMATRKDPNLQLRADTIVMPTDERTARPEHTSTMVMTKQKVDARLVRGIQIVAGSEPATLRVKSILSFYPFSESVRHTHWRLVPLTSRETCMVTIALVRGNSRMVATHHELSRGASLDIEIPATAADCDKDSLDLEISISNTGRDGAILIDHQVMTRTRVIAECRGVGVEIGPGTNPQIRPSPDTDVSYIEQSSPDQWSELYVRGKKIDTSLWTNYRIGEAHDLPVDDDSLDFVFCSHVFEHLANPLGHLQYWKTKLRRNGKVAAVIPTVTGCKDYVFQPCKTDDLLEEFSTGIWEPTLDHYIRWARFRAPKSDPAELMKIKRSIHVHFYDRKNIEQLLQLAVDRLGYASFEIEFVPNHKDMHFVLKC